MNQVTSSYPVTPSSFIYLPEVPDASMVPHLRHSRRTADDRVESLLSRDPNQFEPGELATVYVALGGQLAGDPVQTIVADAHGGRKGGVLSGTPQHADGATGVERHLQLACRTLGQGVGVFV